MMDSCSYQQQNDDDNAAAWMRGDVMNGVVCPRPRRLGPYIYDPTNPGSSTRWQQNYSIYQAAMRDSEAATELLDMILTKEHCGTERANNPFFCGSPPTRASNPLIQDAESGNNDGRVKFTQKTATVRVEGFKCQGISSLT